MVEDAATQRVEITFVGTPPTGQIERASGVTDVEVNGQVVRCLVYGSFQPFLEAVRGYDFIVSASVDDTGVLAGAFLEVLLAIAVVGTGVTLYPVIRRVNEGMALGHV